MNRSIEWPESHIQYLRDHWETDTVEAIANHLNCSISPVRRKAMELGLPTRIHKGHVVWTDEMLEILDREWEHKTAKELAEVLGCRKHSVLHMAQKRGLPPKRPPKPPGTPILVRRDYHKRTGTKEVNQYGARARENRRSYGQEQAAETLERLERESTYADFRELQQRQRQKISPMGDLPGFYWVCSGMPESFLERGSQKQS